LTAKETISALGYDQSPNFLRPRDFTWDRMGAFAHVLRKAGAELSLQGAYSLRGSGDAVPLVYVCEVADEGQVRDIHRLVWNQDIVPCLILSSPLGTRVYSGFGYDPQSVDGKRGLLEPLVTEPDELARLSLYSSDSIDSGKAWDTLSSKISPTTRLNVRLLDNLKRLDKNLQQIGKLPRATSHALIGKYVYLHYLRDRGILSAKKLDRWGFSEADVFGAKSSLSALEAVSGKLDDWLNGGVFPIDFSRKSGLRSHHVKWVSGIFSGEEISESGDHQLHLDFPAYDFSFIPVETLSVVYEQFLNDTPVAGGKKKSNERGAFYTPIPVVNLMLSQMDHELPLKKGMRVFDPTCGSGAFLVQSYRRLIEREFPEGSDPTPGQLRELLQESIFGIDSDEDACGVTELSLILTLLDYVKPPDLEGAHHRFKLPSLRGENIVCADFFSAPAPKRARENLYDWVVGNPPWKKISLTKPQKGFGEAAQWIKEHSKTRPVGNNEVGRAIAWEVGKHLAPDGRASLLLPAMSLFETAAKPFRREFFTAFDIGTVVNFSNLAEVLADRRFRVPAAALFFKHAGEAEPESLRVFSPLVANQEVTRPRSKGKRIESWVITVDTSDVREIPYPSIAEGESLPWKIASWGCPADAALLRRLRREFPSLGELEKQGVIVASQGLENRKWSTSEKLEEVREIVGKKTYKPPLLARWRGLFRFPEDCLSVIPEEERWVRCGRAELPLSICRPPHVIVSAARNFAIFSDEYLIVPARQIGIVSPENDSRFLKALAVFLSSDFARYHEFLSSSQFGVQRGLATIQSLRRMAVPISKLDHKVKNEWAMFHDRMCKAKPRKTGGGSSNHDEFDFSGGEVSANLEPLMEELNRKVSEALGLTDREQALIRSLVHVRIHLNDGNIGEAAIRPPGDDDLKAYCEALKQDLDGFLGLTPRRGHGIAILNVGGELFLRITEPGAEGVGGGIQIKAKANAASSAMIEAFMALKGKNPQWTYFRRALRCYVGRETYLLKPAQRFQWTVAQATMDASSIIADKLANESET
jgi:hypothetical protein